MVKRASVVLYYDQAHNRHKRTFFSFLLPLTLNIASADVTPVIHGIFGSSSSPFRGFLLRNGSDTVSGSTVGPNMQEGSIFHTCE